MVSVLGVLAALIPRTLFGCHGLLCVWLVVQFNSGELIYYSMCAGLACLFVETLFTLFVRKGAEYKYFWPSCFFYLCTLVPATWKVEMDLLEDRLNNVTESTSVKLPGRLETTISEETAKKICEVGLMLIVILGRWMLPRGLITRDQLSALLLEYVAIAADILELFEAFDEESVARNKEVTMAILAVYSWSLLQFTLVVTATRTEDEEEDEFKDAEKERKKWKDLMKEMEYDPTMPKRKYLRKLKLQQVKREKEKSQLYKAEETEQKMKRVQLQGDLYGILAAILTQDGPFLVLRLLLMTKYEIQGEMLPFWAGKNAIALVLLFYRLYIIQFKKKEEERAAAALQRFRNASFMVLSAKFMESNSRKKGVMFGRSTAATKAVVPGNS